MSQRTAAGSGSKKATVKVLAAASKPLRWGLRGARATLERTLHPVRRRKAIREIRRLRVPRTVLFVCLGNICRSPYAAIRLRDLLTALWGPDNPLGVSVESGGFILPGRESPFLAVDVAEGRGVDLGGHRSRVIDGSMVEDASLIVVMTSDQERKIRQQFGPSTVVHLGDLDPAVIVRRDITDPYGQTRHVFGDVYARIDRTLGVMVDLFREFPESKCGENAR